MKKINLLLLLSLIIILLSNCKKKKDDPTPDSPTTVAQDKQNITNSFTSLANCVGAIKDGDGAKAVEDFVGLTTNGNTVNDDWAEKIIEKLDSMLDLNSVNNSNMFDFSANTGTYTWNPATSVYTKVSSPTDKIIVKFPSTPGSATNNATLTLSNYQQTPVVISTTTYYLPVAFDADLVVDGVTLFSLNGTAAYDDPVPTSVNVALMLKPFTVTLTGSRLTPTKFQAGMSLSNSSNCTTSISATVEFTSSDYENIDVSKDVKSINGTVIHDNLKIVTFADMASLQAITDPTVSQYNAYVKSSVYFNNAKIGDLILYDDGSGTDKIYIVYKDGSQEDVQTYFDNFNVELKAILTPQFGDLGL